jgi:hypothetical protein
LKQETDTPSSAGGKKEVHLSLPVTKLYDPVSDEEKIVSFNITTLLVSIDKWFRDDKSCGRRRNGKKREGEKCNANWTERCTSMRWHGWI